MSTIAEKREAIRKVYPGVNWRMKVDNMEDNQVIAVYLSFEKNGTFKKDLKKHNKPYKDKYGLDEKQECYPKQLSIDDIYRNVAETCPEL